MVGSRTPCLVAATVLLLVLPGCIFDRSGLQPSPAEAGHSTLEWRVDHPTVPDHDAAVDVVTTDAALRDGPPPPDLPVSPPPDLGASELSTAPDLPLPDLPLTPDLPLSPDGPVGPLDTDGDGIPDFDDPCPNTPNPLTLQDAFNSSAGWTTYSGSWSINGGDWLQSQLLDSGSAQHLYRSSFNVTDVYIELSASFVQTIGTNSRYFAAGARTTLGASKHYHKCSIYRVSATSYELGGFTRDGSSTTTSVKNPTPSQGNGPYAIRFSIRGSNAKCWVSGQQANAAVWSAGSPASGTVELITQRATARFHQIRVYGIPAVCN